MYITLTQILFIFILVDQCYSQSRCSLQYFQFEQIASRNNNTVRWRPPTGTADQTISFGVCNPGIPNGCGNFAGINQCYNTPSCCAVCQSWQEDIGPAGACLGLSAVLKNVTAVSDTQVKITYGNGDYVEGTPRQVDILISCNSSADVLSFVDFTAPYPISPPPPFYLYQLYLSSSQLCGTRDCILPGFNFNPIAGRRNYTYPWKPPNLPNNQTITYAPCSRGVPLGCGNNNAINQCVNNSSCCAVCQSWQLDTGPTGICLGLSSKLTSIKAITDAAVQLTYSGGDPINQNIPSQVDVWIFCDAMADRLNFIDFIPAPTNENPPPTVYKNTLMLTSSELCSKGCSLPGFNFKEISAQTYSYLWIPPGQIQPQTISYAPCSSGLPLGCGNAVYNQCWGKRACCAVCHTITTLGVAYCLGLSTNLANITKVSDDMVRITYNGGDISGSLSREVDIWIICDAGASVLSFIDFIPSPPTPIYKYTLILSSSMLCRKDTGTLPSNHDLLIRKLKDIGIIP